LQAEADQDWLIACSTWVPWAIQELKLQGRGQTVGDESYRITIRLQRERLAKLQEALQWYADAGDFGRRAREALNP
jgi:hypothetical protein